MNDTTGHRQNDSQPWPVSVVILAHRLDERLEAAINSASDAAEVVVAHTNPDYDLPDSRDVVKHIRLAAAPADFAAWRNQALNHAGQPWTFFLDSDEVITPESRQELAALSEANPAESPYVYSVRRVDYFYGQPLGWGEVKKVELARLGPTHRLRSDRPVHEVIAADLPSRPTNITVHHFPHPSISQFILKVSRYAKLEAAHRYQQGEQFSLWQTLAYPAGKWLYNMGWRLAWRDGWRGVVYATLMSLHSFWVRVYLYEHWRDSSHK